MQRAFLMLIGVVLLVLAQFNPSSEAANIDLTGREPHLWSSGGLFLIVARVTDVQILELGPNENATHILSLEPLFTIAGAFDPSQVSQVRARAHIGRTGSWVEHLPSKGAIVLTLVTPGNIGGDDARPFPWIAPEICHFMPNEQGHIILTGVDDKRVQETLERIRKERAAGEAEAAAEKRAEPR